MQRAHNKRALRLSDQIMREVADILVHELEDPRLSLVTISGARMNADMRVVEVLYTLGKDEERAAEAQAGLDHAKGYVKRQLAGRLKLRQVPELRFCRDTFLEDMVYRGQPGSGQTAP